MKKKLMTLLLLAFTASSCNSLQKMNQTMEQSNQTIIANTQTIQNSTLAIDENSKAIDKTSQMLEENLVGIKKLTHLLDKLQKHPLLLGLCLVLILIFLLGPAIFLVFTYRWFLRKIPYMQNETVLKS